MSRTTNFHGPKDIRATEVRLYSRNLVIFVVKWLHLYAVVFLLYAVSSVLHYENMPIQIYWKFNHHENEKF